MLREQVKPELGREPFVPFRLHLKNGKTVDIPFRDVAHDMGYGLVVFVGLKQGTRRAKRVATYFYDDILRIEQRPADRGHRRRKAS
jgi:hypothetical protein